MGYGQLVNLFISPEILMFVERHQWKKKDNLRAFLYSALIRGKKYNQNSAKLGDSASNVAVLTCIL